VGCGQSEIEAVKADEHEAHDECRSKENCGGQRKRWALVKAKKGS
jgi:hypothetical protein